MSDNVRRFMAVRTALIQHYPGTPSKRLMRHLTTLAGMVAGIVASGSCQLTKLDQRQLFFLFSDNYFSRSLL